jgi:CRP-like cAMP-binding protein
MSAGRTLEYAELLARVELFAGVDRVTLARLAAHLEPTSVADGALVVRQGDPADAFYLVARGTLGVYIAADESAELRRINTLTAGAPFGEMGLLTGESRSATVRAEGDADVLRLSRSQFLDLVHREPQVALAIAATLSRRLRVAQSGDSSITSRIAEIAEKSRLTPTARSAARSTTRSIRSTIGLGLAGAILLVMWAAPPPAGLSERQ